MPSTSIWSKYSKSSDAIFMYLCYLDESGVPEIPGNSTHFVLAGIAIPIERWREADATVTAIMARYGLAGAELHSAWLLRKYLEQSKIDGFEALGWDERRNQVAQQRVSEIHRVRKFGIAKRNSQLKKIFRHTDAYTHLSFHERLRLATEIAETIANWEWAVLFASCVDKAHFLTQRKFQDVNTFAFSRVMIQFAQFLDEATRSGWINPAETQADKERTERFEAGAVVPEYGLLIHDNNPTVALKHTQQLRAIQNDFGVNRGQTGHILEYIVETPLFVDSSLTRMIQLADLWGYAVRRYVENGEASLFSILHRKRTMHGGTPYRLRTNTHHFASPLCPCAICADRLVMEDSTR